MLIKISEMDYIRRTRKRYSLRAFIFVLSILFFFIFVSSNPINSQLEETNTDVEIDIDEIEDEIELSPGLDEDSSCKIFELLSVGTDPAFYYYVDEILNPYKNTIKVELIDAQTWDLVKVSENEKQEPRKFWKSKVDKENFRVFENWTYRPVNHHDTYRLRLNIGGRICFSEEFQIIQ